ncbi:MAG: transglutaminase-like domain-containing protein, partial [Oscillospiraceae bacterium]|nr:transglutaminase-like domain-containing protein [Oscillospiraceae bacterium]
MTQNDDYRFLHLPLPADVERLRQAGDIEGCRRLICAYLNRGCGETLAARLRCEENRLGRLEDNYPYNKAAALALLREEWADCTEEQFDALVDAGRIDWRYINGEKRYIGSFVGSLRNFPKEAPGLKHKTEDHTRRDQMLARMKNEGQLSASITIKATIKPKPPAKGKKVQAWLPVPANCPQQSDIEILSATPGYVLAPADSPARTIYWESSSEDSFEVVYRYTHKAVYVDPLTLPCDMVQPDFDTGEELPHIAFTPYLRALCADITKDCKTAMEKAHAIYQYVTEKIDYRFQPSYALLDAGIAEHCALSGRGDCGVMALLFITLCRIAGIPARWQSGLSVSPDSAGPHDWCLFYIAPYGWLYADPSFGSGARRNGEATRRKHYFGNLDPQR